jgi:hypothetical protein
MRKGGRRRGRRKSWDGWSGKGRGALQGGLDDLELHEELGGLAFYCREAKVAVKHILGILENGVERIGVGGGDREVNLVAEFEPREMDESQADGAFEFAGGVEDEAAIGGREDSWDGVADALGQCLPAVVVGNPMGDVGIEGGGDIIGCRGFSWRSRSLRTARAACGSQF